jgi:energy-coupling factor transport system substrate-specific component
VSWQLGSLLILGAALLAGFGWYERSKPPARVLALVAALAALAVVGRLAFAAFPNVKPTTDIVALSGYALGPVPGFAIGAVTAPASNVFLGQGPWTAWQMAGWAAVGVAGAGLGMLGLRLGRVALALACGIFGLAFGALMDVYQWTFAAEQTLDSYLAISATSLPYNVAHAIGNVVFCLAFGPAFVRAVSRFRRRFEVHWRPSVAVAALAALVLFVPASYAAPALERGARYLERAQNADGGFGPARGQGSSQLHSGWAALGLAAAGRNPRDVRRGGRSVVDFIRSRAGQLDETGELERTIIVLRAAGLAPRRFAGRDLLADLLRHRRQDGSFDGYVNWTGFGILALRAAGQGAGSGAVRAAVRYLERSQGDDGGFGFAPDGASDVDDTGAVLQALAAAGRGRSPAARRAVSYLRRAQNPDGGFGQTPERSSNAQSTAFAVQGLIAAGRDPDRLRKGSRTPLAYLASLQVRDGSFRYSRTSAQTPVWVTAQALTALARRPFPLRPVPRARARGSVERRPKRAAPARGARRRAEPARRRRARAPAVAGPGATRPAALSRPADGANGGDEGDGPPVAAIALALAGAAAGLLVVRARRH